MIPALMPNPTSARTNIAVAIPGVRLPRQPRDEPERAAGPVQEGEQGEQAQRGHVGRDQVKPSCFADFLPVIFRGDEEKGRDGHDLPREEKQEGRCGEVTTSAMPPASRP
jgi:hypothetical protein